MRLTKRITDCGRSTVLNGRYDYEKNDCTVRALSKAGGITYDHAHQIMAEEGRRPGHGSSVFLGIINAAAKNLFKYHKISLVYQERKYNAAPGFLNCAGRPILGTKVFGPTIKQFIEQHPRGRFILRIKKHVFAVINGIMYDKYKQHGGAEVQAAWEIY